MVYDLCNIGTQKNQDTFHEISIIRSDGLPAFGNLEKNQDILSVLNALDEDHDVLHIPLLPEKYSVSKKTTLSNKNAGFNVNINFPITPQDRNLNALLNDYNNHLVIAVVRRRLETHLYGTPLQPLTFSYDETNPNKPEALKGYTIFLKGSVYGAGHNFTAEDIDENPLPRGLAFELAGRI